MKLSESHIANQFYDQNITTVYNILLLFFNKVKMRLFLVKVNSF